MAIVRRLLQLPQLLVENPFHRPPKLPERMIWTSSSIKLFRTCKRKWFWKYIMGLRIRTPDRHLVIGRYFHETLGQWYRGKRSNILPIAMRYWREMQPLLEISDYFDQDDYDKLRVLVDSFPGMMAGYEVKYNDDRRNWLIYRESIEHEFRIKFQDFDYAGKVDLVARDPRAGKSGPTFLVEHKTAGQINESYIDRLPLDLQIRGYTYATVHELGIPASHVTYDVVRKSKLRRKANETRELFIKRVTQDYVNRQDFNYYREDIEFKPEHLDSFEYEVHQVHREYKHVTSNLEMLFDKHDPPVAYIDPRAWHPNDHACNDYFRLCEYFPLCTSGLSRATGVPFRQADILNEELSIED